jgi:alcohol dehydrogenase (cytochrome c)
VNPHFPGVAQTSRALTEIWGVSLFFVAALADNWVSYNGDYTGARYSAMTQITPANAGRLAAQWVFHARAVSPLEVTPMVVSGIMFVTSVNDAYALDAKTGKLLWHHARAVTPGLVDDAGQHHNRGVAILGMRLYMETDNAHLLCLDARSGNLIWACFSPSCNGLPTRHGWWCARAAICKHSGQT